MSDSNQTQATVSNNATSGSQSNQKTQNTSQQGQGAVEFKSAPFYMQNDFAGDLKKFQAYQSRMTGYPNLDAMQPFYPGLYALGAISSLGKTTFVHQLAGQVAATGVPVLYFSLEQSALELYSKALSRCINLHAAQDPTYQRYTSLEIRRGLAGQREMSEQTRAYLASVQNNLYIVECNFNMDVDMLIGSVNKFISDTNTVPVVIVDYLQILSPPMIGGRTVTDTRAAVDYDVHALKSFQSSRNLTVIAVCSLNRANYLVPVDFESFKESGSIEYTADVVWGLQLSVITTPEFTAKTIYEKGGKSKSVETNLTEKRAMINAAKNADVRDIQLATLKNRYGRSSFTVEFKYQPKYDTFIPVMSPDDDLAATDIGAFRSLTDDTPTPFD